MNFRACEERVAPVDAGGLYIYVVVSAICGDLVGYFTHVKM